MSKRDQVLVIEPPNELTFTGPFTQAVYSYMKLKNPSARKVCFKIKTTAPKRYCVKPNSGVVDPNTEVSIAVSLQPFEFDPAEKNKHKFMVQSMFAPEGEEINQDTLWKDADQNELMDSKLKCVFALPPGLEQNTVEETKYETKFENTRSQAAAPPKSEVKPLYGMKAETGSEQMTAAVGEIKKLNDQLSQLRQENINLKEETLRLKRIAAASEKPQDSPSYSSTTVTAVGPSNEVLPTTHIYAALIILVLGVMLGKFFL